MYQSILQLLKIKPHETPLVKKLFAIQFLLGMATAFLFTSSITIFISEFSIRVLPEVYIFSAFLLFIFNRLYKYFEERLSPAALLQLVILFAVGSTLFFWLGISFLPHKLWPFAFAGWYLLLYMLINYAFWGMASIMFNVRESKRLFSLVGAGDIPAKMLGYVSVSFLVPVIGVNNLLWVPVVTGLCAWLLVRMYSKDVEFAVLDNAAEHEHHTENEHHHPGESKPIFQKLFGTGLVFFIAAFSLLSYVVFAFIDFTFLSEIKYRFGSDSQLASFIAIFFAAGRLAAIFFKILFSSRFIARFGLANSLLVTPLALLCITFFMIVSGSSIASPFYMFGAMVLLSEILRSTLQEPVFFILFQPLKPPDRLKGHLVAKGHTMPFALLGVGTFLFLYLRRNDQIPLIYVAEIMISFIILWCISVFIIQKQYLKTIITSLKKGYFTGSSLFLNDEAVTGILLQKTESRNPIKVIHALNLLEKSGYSDRHKLLLKFLQNPEIKIRKYVLSRIIANKMTVALPLIQKLLNAATDEKLMPLLNQSLFYLKKEVDAEMISGMKKLNNENKKAAMVGLLLRGEEEIKTLINKEIKNLTQSKRVIERMLALEIISESCNDGCNENLSMLLKDDEININKKAIETAGVVKDVCLIEEVKETVQQKNLYSVFKTALLNYGDGVFIEKYFSGSMQNTRMIKAVIKSAAKMSGENSTHLLLSYLSQKRFTDETIEALWLKKAVVTVENIQLINEQIKSKIEHSNIKLSYYLALVDDKELVLLQEALKKELQKDLKSLLYLFSLIYDREKINRIIELLTLGSTERISNAIEMLELLLPTKTFLQINNLIEWLQDIINNNIPLSNNVTATEVILKEIFAGSRASIHSWTRSVACYSLLKLGNSRSMVHTLEGSSFSKDDHLFSETKNYVLSMLK